MSRNLPYGFRDILPDEFAANAAVEKALSDVFSSYGYERVQTSTLENYETCAQHLGVDDMKSAFKFSDGDGTLVAMRPDVTMQICRLAPNLIGDVNRVYYCMNSFENAVSVTGARAREFLQCGAELLGESGEAGDVEMIQLAVSALKNAGLKHFLIEIGHVGFFDGLVEKNGLKPEEAKYLRALIDSKDALGAELYLKDKLNPHAAADFLELPELFGDDVLSRAEKFTGDIRCAKAIEELRHIESAADKLGISNYIAFDLAAVPRHSYYGGIVLRGLADSYGLSVLDGGRYDKLSAAFGKSQAVGFCIGVERLIRAIGLSGKHQAPDIVFICDDYAAERLYIEPLRKAGVRAAKAFCKTTAELKKYCQSNNIGCAAVVKNDGIDYVLGGEQCLRLH